jgi:hypothetical protein
MVIKAIGPVLVIAALLSSSSPAALAQSFRAFGLTNTPLGDAVITFQGATMTVTSDSFSDVAASGAAFLPAGHFGVAIDLGEADAGIWAYPYHNGYFNDGSFLVGHVFGEVDGQAGRPICTMRARRESEGNHSVEADFSAIGVRMQIFEIYQGGTLVAAATNAGGPAIIQTYSQSSPRANPFWRLRDGSIAAVVELDGAQFIELPGPAQGEYGDRLLIRAFNPTSEVKFASRVEVTGGGGLGHFLITELRLGVFNHPHLALGSSLLNAANGKLEVANPDFPSSADQHGVAIELEGLRRFDVALSPVPLETNGASLVASAVGTINRIVGEFMGYAGLRNSNGVLQAFASLAALGPEVEIAVYHERCLVGAALAPSSLAVATLSGTPRIIGITASDDGLQRRAGFVITLDAAATFTLPDGATVEGSEIHFRAANPFPVERITAFNVVASRLAGFTILSETTPQTISLQDYVVDLRPGASIKNFIDYQGSNFTRSVGSTNYAGQPLIRVSDTSSNGTAHTTLLSLQGGDLYYHGGSTPWSDSVSANGARLLPEEIRLGQTYFGVGTFSVWDTNTGTFLRQDTTIAIRAVRFEPVTVPAGTFETLVVESTETSTLTTPNGAEEVFAFRTDWLVAGLGVVKFTAGNQAGFFISGDLVNYNLITSPPRDQTASLGSSVVFDVTVKVLGGLQAGNVAFRWESDSGVAVTGSTEQLMLPNAIAGSYSVAVSNAAGVVSAPVGHLKVIPFTEPACFWAQRAGGTLAGYGQLIYSRSLFLDGASNAYVAGGFSGTATFGQVTLNSAGENDVFLAKLSPAGQYISAIRLGGVASEVAYAGGLDAAGNIYLAGTFNGTANLGTNTVTSAGSDDAFVLKMDASGNVLWAVRGGGGSYDFLSDMEIDSAGNLYIIGTFYGPTATFGATTLVVGPSNGQSSYVAKLDGNGNFLWAQSIGAANATGLALDPGGDVYVVGAIYGSATFGTNTVTTPFGRSAGFLTRMDTNGVFLWVKRAGDGVPNHDVATDSAGNVFVTGGFSGLATFDDFTLSSQGTRYFPDHFLAKVDQRGDVVWVRKLPGTFYYDFTRIAVDGPGNAYVFNSFYGEAEVGLAKLFSGARLLLSKIDSLGRTVWVKQFGGEDPRALTIDGAGNIYLTGSFGSSALFGDFVLNSPVQGSSSYNNLFVARMCTPPVPEILAQPQSQTVDAGTNVTFSVTAANTAGLAYQWRKNGDSIPGATNSSFTMTNVQALDAGDYSVLVSGDGGSVHSAQAKLTVIGPLAGTLAFGAVSYLVGETSSVAFIEVTRSGSQTGMVMVDFVVADGSAEADLDYLPSAGTLRFGDGESVKVFDVPIINDRLFEDDETVMLRLCRPRGGATLGGQTNATLLIVSEDSPAPYIITQPRDRVLGVGNSVTFSVVLSGLAPFHYQWRKNGINISGANGATYTINSAQLADAGNYSLLVTNQSGEAVSRSATLAVYGPPVIHQQPQSQTAERWSSVTFAVIASGVNTVTQTYHRAASDELEDVFIVDTARAAGRLIIDYDFFNVPDLLRVYNEGSLIFDTGLTNGVGSAQVFYAPVYYSSGAVEVVINEGLTGYPGTAWTYQLQVIPETLRYVWRKAGAIIPAANNPNLVLHSLRDEDAGQYTVTVIDQFGSAVSQTATLTVSPPSPPMLRILQVPGTNDLEVIWSSPNFYLESAAEVIGPWGYFNSYPTVVSPGNSRRFFRLRENPPPNTEE